MIKLKTGNPMRFDTLRIGETYEEEGCFFIKFAEVITENGFRYNCLCLDDSCLSHTNDDTSVVPVQIEMTIHY